MRGIANAIRQGDKLAQRSFREKVESGFALAKMSEENVSLVPAIITFITVVVTDLKWKYEWSEVRFTAGTTSVATKASGLAKTNAGFAYNWNELSNVAGFWAPLGNPLNVPLGFKVKPIAINTPVLLFPVRDTTGKVFWIFDKVNAIDGECP